MSFYGMQDGPSFETEITEVSPGVFQRKGTVKKFMMTIRLLQTIAVQDGKITSVQLKKL